MGSAKCCTALMISCAASSVASTKLLLAAREIDVNRIDKCTGRTALHRAAERVHVDQHGLPAAATLALVQVDRPERVVRRHAERCHRAEAQSYSYLKPSQKGPSSVWRASSM